MLGQAAPWLDGILFKKFKQAFGGRVRFIVSGGAPLATHIEEYLAVRAVLPRLPGVPLSPGTGCSHAELSGLACM